mgnify:CR=1 FL=1
MTVTIRRMQEGDIPRVGEIMVTAFNDVFRRHGYPEPFPSPEAGTSLARGYLGLEPEQCFTACLNGQVVGSGFLHLRGNSAGIGPITVDPTCQTKGIGRAIMRAVIDAGSQCRSLRLVQDSFNVVSFPLYAKLGFVVRGTAASLVGHEIHAARVASVEIREWTAQDIGTLAALDKKTGEVIWRSSDWTDGAQYASVVPAELNGQRQFVQLTQKTLAGVSARDGSILWRNAWPGRTAVIPTPIVHRNEVYISSGYGAGCRKITVGGANEVTEDYSNKNMKNKHGGVLLLKGHLYGYSDGRGWTCQNLKSGDVVWDSKKFGKGCVFYADNRLYCLEESSGRVALVGANTGGWKEHGRFKLEPQTELRKSSGRIWTHPVVANGVLYLRDQELLFAFDVKAR